MLVEVGPIFLGLALAAVLYAAFAAFLGSRRSDSRWAQSGRNGVYAATLLLGLALLVLLAAFLANQFQVEYVALHSSRALPLYLKVSALWAGQEGSLLLWSFLQVLFAALVGGRPSERTHPLVSWASVFLNLIAAFFVAVTLFLSNPFALSVSAPLDGQGLNPLLRHPGMIFHPPVLYLGYVGLAVPFAFALAALVTQQVEDWPAAARRWTLAAWLFLGVGLILGARWAYDVLGWGGYWGWDPVENAGLMPWLTATALLHGTVMQDQRKTFRVWNVLLAVLSFVLVLFGTFATRSGMIQSVHAFSYSSLGPYFLAAIGLTLGGSLVLMIIRRAALVTSRSLEGLLSREGMFFLTLVLLLTITASVFVGSVLPTLTEAFAGRRFEAGPEWFDRVVGPQLGALVLLMGVCPLLGRTAAGLKRLRTRGWPALLGAALLTVGAALAGFTRPVSLVGFAVIGLAGTTMLAEYARDAAERSRQKGEFILEALWNLFGRNRRRYGGYLVHTGVILMALGVVGTRLYPFETDLVLALAQPATVQDYVLVLEDMQQEPAEDHLSTQAVLSVYRNNAYLATLRPQMDQYANSGQTVGVPALRTSLREDLYVVLAGWGSVRETAALKVFVNPLASFLWLGSLVFLAGGAVALWPPTRTARLPVSEARRRKIGTAVGLAVGILVLVAAGVAMWGGSRPQSRGRPLAGQMAPDFTLDLLDGSTLTLSDLRGQVVVVNFWATWCPPCEDELPDLQAVWEGYQADGVIVIGVAFQEETAAVQEIASRFGVTYLLGLDMGERISEAYGITAVPETFVVDQQGRVAYIHIGPVTADELRAELDGLLAGR
ncbi:MAG: cytochrome c biogenesis protein CcsA [Anaerolineae bacterium]|nr:cytochrome c biogenesis protein CcsA [Anaerolineae bacterium]